MHVNVAFSTLLIIPKMLAPYGLNLQSYKFFMDHVQEKILNINSKTNIYIYIYIQTYTHQTL
jgi:hypothetical protein